LKHKGIVVLGPTGSGKTDLAHRICDQDSQCQIINLDVFQSYKELSIGTNKPTIEEIKHYQYKGIDIYFPWEKCDAQMFSQYVISQINQIHQDNKIPILCGGSTLYSKAILYHLDSFPKVNQVLRDWIHSGAKFVGHQKFYDLLKTFDPQKMEKISPMDHYRIERSLEIYLQTPPSTAIFPYEGLSKEPKIQPGGFKALTERFPDFLKIILPKKNENEDLAKRIDFMFSQGWIEEVNSLISRYGSEILKFPAFKAIGYEDIFHQIMRKSIDLAELKSIILHKTHQYSRRQNTWFKQMTQENHTHLMVFEGENSSVDLKYDEILSYLS
jgi:tRNA dimethylallyltransferase